MLQVVTCLGGSERVTRENGVNPLRSRRCDRGRKSLKPLSGEDGKARSVG